MGMFLKDGQKGFTLVEVAIVLTIIGLLIAGILKGQQLLAHARITATVEQVKAINAALTMFRDQYNMLPGDMADGNTRIPRCPLACGSGGAVVATIGDGFVGLHPWNLIGSQMLPFTGVGIPNANNAFVGNEPVVFWVELSHAGLLKGITDDGVMGVANAMAYGRAFPAARIGGGFTVGSSGGNTVAGTAPAAMSISGLVLKLSQLPPYLSESGFLTGTGTQVLTGAQAASIDRKLDDGNASTGIVQGLSNTAFGVPVPATGAGSCYNAAVPATYTETNPGKDCGLYIKIQ